jgi:Methyltransferase domain
MSLQSVFKSIIKRLPGIAKIVAQRDALLASTGFVPPGHFLSPIISIPEYLADQKSAHNQIPTQLLGIDLNERTQLEVVKSLAPFWQPDLFSKAPNSSQRYYANNPAFGVADAFALHAMIRHVKPKRLIEVGSGFSSCVTLDTNERFFDNAIDLTFIEPFPQVFHKLVRPQDLGRVTLLQERLQDVPFELFAQLEAGDILFIDSTHVSKVGSDVNYLFFEILPRLSSGVIVHIHDIFYPFDYPKEWIMEGRSWNEAFVLRSFLQYNQKFEILLFASYMITQHAALMAELYPTLPMNGGSIWLGVK